MCFGTMGMAPGPTELQERGHRFRQEELHRARAGGPDLGDVGNGLGDDRGRQLLVAVVGEAEDDVLGRKGLAVVPAHVLAQLEGVDEPVR